ncbi:MAG: hypothetical protein KDB54_03270 [Solirubrobacterales bacterium]|nr:hypothetical protein [Solirubrobacterales bacterium]
MKQTKGRFKAVTVAGPATMGRYWYRIVITRNGRFRGKSPARGLLVLDKVPLERMVRYPVSQTVQVGSSLFRYVWFDSSLYRKGDTVLRMDSTSCRALSVQGIGKDTEDADVWFEMVQETGDPSTTFFRTNQLVSTGMGLTGGAFVLKMGSTGYGVDGYVNGFGLCFTKDGRLARR